MMVKCVNFIFCVFCHNLKKVTPYGQWVVELSQARQHPPPATVPSRGLVPGAPRGRQSALTSVGLQVGSGQLRGSEHLVQTGAGGQGPSGDVVWLSPGL